MSTGQRAMMRAWRVWAGVALGTMLVAMAWGQSPASMPAANPPVCVNAEIDGVHALSYACLNRQLAPSAAAGASMASGVPTDAPSNRLGIFNQSAERNRFGNNWGKSVTPQRPPAVPVVPPH